MHSIALRSIFLSSRETGSVFPYFEAVRYLKRYLISFCGTDNKTVYV